MVAVLHLVGRRLEQPEIVRKLLDVGSWGDKPQYNMAAEVNTRTANDQSVFSSFVR